MVVEKNTPKAKETLENDALKETKNNVPNDKKEKKESKNEPKPAKSKSKKKALCLISLGALCIFIGVLLLPATIKGKLIGLNSQIFSIKKVEKKKTLAKNPQAKVYAEQKKIKKEFDKAKVVTGATNPPSVVVETSTDVVAMTPLKPAFKRLQKDNSLNHQILQAQSNQNKKIENAIRSISKTEQAIDSQMNQVDKKIGLLQKGKADVSVVYSLMDRVEKTEKKLSASNIEKERNVTLLLGLFQLREAIYRGGVYNTELQSVLVMTNNNPVVRNQLKSLLKMANKGLFSKQTLLQSFDSYAKNAVIAQGQSPKTDWFHQAVNSLKKLVVIRRIDTSVRDNSTASILALAQKSVENQDLLLAVAELQLLKGVARMEMQPWIRAVKDYLTAEDAVNESIAFVLKNLYAQQGRGV